MIGFIKKILLKYQRLSIIFAYLYTHIFGLNKIKRKNQNKIYLKNCFIRKSQIKIKGIKNAIYVGNQCVLNKCSIKISGNNNKVFIGNKVSAVKCEIHIEDDNNYVQIGEETHISGQTHLACIEGCKIIIGERCLFSSDIIFRTGDSHSILDLEGNRMNFSQNIVIGNHVWIGNKTILTKGVEIPENSIIATGALVTKKFDDSNIIIGGVPAKVIKRGVNWEERRI